MRMHLWLFLRLACSAAARADDVAAPLRDRPAIERVYYNHRLRQNKEKTDTTLSAACLSLPKRSYEEWLTQLGFVD